MTEGAQLAGPMVQTIFECRESMISNFGERRLYDDCVWNTPPKNLCYAVIFAMQIRKQF